MSLPENPRAVSLSILAWERMRSFVSRSARVSGPITAVCGIIADLASTIAKFSLYLFIGAFCLALVSGAVWFARYRHAYRLAMADHVMRPDEFSRMSEQNAWSILFAFSTVATIVMGGFVVADKMAGQDDKGVIASVVPGMDKVQDSLFRVEKKIDAVKEDTGALRTETAAVKEDTTKLVASVEEMAKNFAALAPNGGIIASAKTPEEHYHNARLQEVGGNFSAARQEYAAYLQANLEVLDPWLSYSAMLKAQEGRAGALETLRYFGEKVAAPTISYRTAVALLEEGEARVAQLARLYEEHPEFGPLPYLLSQEYSEARVGEQTVANQKAESGWLEKFRAAHAEGHFVRYFLDQKEAQKWVEQGETRWAKLQSVPARVLANPVTVTTMNTNQGVQLTFGMKDYQARELFYRLDGKGDFVSTGQSAIMNSQTGLPMINLSLALPAQAAGEHTVEVRYLDKNGQMNGPYTLKYGGADQQMAQGKMLLNATSNGWLEFREFNGKTLLYFTALMSYRPYLQEVRYSLDNDKLDRVFKFKPTEKLYEVGNDLYLSVPKTTQFANVQLTYKDGSKSGLFKFDHTK
jgi:hypothetical protein